MHQNHLAVPYKHFTLLQGGFHPCGGSQNWCKGIHLESIGLRGSQSEDIIKGGTHLDGMGINYAW